MMEYYDILSQIHKILKPKTYVEIGVRNGQSLQLASSRTLCVGIDPKFQINAPINIDSKLYTLTSDEFFAKHELKRILSNNTLDLAFIDGMHLFEYALRDFMNLEKYCGKGSFIVLHDCLPIDRVTSRRERSTEVWTGDIWKLIPCLKKYRLDLDIKLLDVPPSGLAIITNLNSKSDNLFKNINEIIAEFIPMEYEYYEKHKTDIFQTMNYSGSNLEKVFIKKRPSNIISGIKKSINQITKNKPKCPKCLCVLLCYNDSDILKDLIEYMLDNHHDIIAWDHGSDDNTAEELNQYKLRLTENKFVPRSVDFYNLYPLMSRNLIENYIQRYDWISWPDDDEILEGPDRKKTYYQHICDVFNSPYNFIKFNNYNYWFTDEDDVRVSSPIKRIKRYSIFRDCAPRIRSWRASATNIREFNHNLVAGEKYPVDFNLRHYPMRTYQQMIKRLDKDRANIQRGNMNYHYNNMKTKLDKLKIISDQLHYDDGISELNPETIFNWRTIYGYPVQ